MANAEAVRALYERYPYPSINPWQRLFSRLSPGDLPALNAEALMASAWGVAPNLGRPVRILVAGCGAFEPVAVMAANPGAEVWAVDFSEASLNKARKQFHWPWNRSGVPQFVNGDLESCDLGKRSFDLIVCTGVLHHCPHPERVLANLKSHLSDFGVLRLMVYSKWGRELLYRTKELAALCGWETSKKFRQGIELLPRDHPFRVWFYLYGDSSSETGLHDGYLHPHDQPRSALEWIDFFGAAADLRVTGVLQNPEGDPESDFFSPEEKHSIPWEKRLAALELLGELQENFYFLLVCSQNEPSVNVKKIGRWNRALQGRGAAWCRLAGAKVPYDTNEKTDPGEIAKRCLFYHWEAQ
jgi:SAM-dependent methyltransferase